jgi:hypothetical protein
MVVASLVALVLGEVRIVSIVVIGNQSPTVIPEAGLEEEVSDSPH